jgi:hypothetical protein
MKPNDWRFAGGIVDRDNVKPAGTFRDAALCQEVLSGPG